MLENDLDYEFYEDAIETKRPVLAFLINGVRLDGTILKQDERSLIMTKKDGLGTQVVYKHAISTMSYEKGKGAQNR